MKLNVLFCEHVGWGGDDEDFDALWERFLLHLRMNQPDNVFDVGKRNPELGYVERLERFVGMLEGVCDEIVQEVGEFDDAGGFDAGLSYDVNELVKLVMEYRVYHDKLVGWVGSDDEALGKGFFYNMVKLDGRIIGVLNGILDFVRVNRVLSYEVLAEIRRVIGFYNWRRRTLRRTL